MTKSYTWNRGNVIEGIFLINQDKVPLIFLGEEGRGRRYEKIALGHKNAPQVSGNAVLDAKAVKITLPARDGKPERPFYILQQADKGDPLLIRICTQWTYTKGSIGSWETVSGNPENIVVGHGAHGTAGRVGRWADGLVRMQAGDAIKITPEGGYKTQIYCLWIDENGIPQTETWQDYEYRLAIEQADPILPLQDLRQQSIEEFKQSMRESGNTCLALARTLEVIHPHLANHHYSTMQIARTMFTLLYGKDLSLDEFRYCPLSEEQSTTFIDKCFDKAFITCAVVSIAQSEIAHFLK
jgi:hypothetical protein